MNIACPDLINCTPNKWWYTTRLTHIIRVCYICEGRPKAAPSDVIQNNLGSEKLNAQNAPLIPLNEAEVLEFLWTGKQSVFQRAAQKALSHLRSTAIGCIADSSTQVVLFSSNFCRDSWKCWFLKTLDELEALPLASQSCQCQSAFPGV